jgi:hypothetical protein
LNGPWVLGRAEKLARRLVTERNDPALVEQAYRLALGRSPDAVESQAAVRFLREQPKRIDAAGGPPEGRTTRDQALVDFCHVLLNSNELIYLD